MIQKQDLAIVAYLRQNARIKLTQLSRKTGIPVSTLFDRLHNPPCLGIRRLAALLDFGALGFSVQAMLLLKAAKNKRDELQAHLLKAMPVNSLMRVNNGYDFLAECVFKDMRELEEFIEHLERAYGVKDKEVHFVVDELKQESFLSNPALTKIVFGGENNV